MSDAPLRSARSAGSWSVLFALYLLVLTTATHWPSLRLPGRSPISDKGLHLLCFAIFTVLLWRTQWIRNRWLVLLLAAAWSVIDEISQGLPGLHRHVSWDDGLANLLGVGVAAAWLWALRPLGREPNRMRLAFQQLLFEEFFRHWRAWLIAVITFLICAVPVVLVWPRYGADEKSVPVFAGIAAWLVITPLLWAPFWVRRAREGIVGT